MEIGIWCVVVLVLRSIWISGFNNQNTSSRMCGPSVLMRSTTYADGFMK